MVARHNVLIAVGAAGLKALLAYPGPAVNPDALKDRSNAGAGISHGSPRAASVEITSKHSLLKTQEAYTCPL